MVVTGRSATPDRAASGAIADLLPNPLLQPSPVGATSEFSAPICFGAEFHSTAPSMKSKAVAV